VRLPWTVLQPSARERRWLQVARFGAIAGAGASITALLASEPPAPWAACVVLLAVLGLVLLPRRRSAWQLAIADDGRVVGRAADNAPERRLQCLFASTWLITLRVGTEVVPVWPDSLPTDSYRRLWVHLRWTHAGSPAAVNGVDDRR
jgi:hypothetical protein